MTSFSLEEEVLRATRDWYLAHPTVCSACKGIRFKRCQTCGGEINSFGDFRDSQRPRQVYETRQEWEAVNGKSEPNVPDRKLQP